MDAKTAIQYIIEEFARATKLHGEFHSRHEGFAIIKEEVDELWDEVKKNGRDTDVALEATQVGAMALRFLVDCCYKDQPNG